jgi:hypothetical protein
VSLPETGKLEIASTWESEVVYVEMDGMVQIARLIALKQGYHIPMLFLDGTIAKAPMILGKFPDEHEEKVKYLYRAGKNFSKKNEIGKLNKVFFISEAWMGRITNTEAFERGEFIRPSLDPKRIETLVVSCLDCATKAQTVKTLEYVRDQKGDLTELKDVDLPDGVIAKSLLLPAFVVGYNDSQ